MSHVQLTDVAALSLASAGAVTTMLPMDYAALGVAISGGIVGGFISVAMIPESAYETRRSRAVKWAVASLSSICLSPFLFERWTHPTVDVLGHVTAQPMLAPTAASMLALSTGIGFVAWITLRIGQAAWEKWLRDKLFPNAAPLPRKDGT